MKRFLGAMPNISGSNSALLLLRVGLGALMLVHGIPKLQMLLSGQGASFPAVLGMSGTISLAMAVLTEVFCTALVIIGLGTRYAAIPVILTMLVAVFLVHGADPFAQQELALMYLLGFLAILLGGSGKYSVDYLLARNDIRSYHPKAKPEDPTVTIYQ